MDVNFYSNINHSNKVVLSSFLGDLKYLWISAICRQLWVVPKPCEYQESISLKKFNLCLISWEASILFSPFNNNKYIFSNESTTF